LQVDVPAASNGRFGSKKRAPKGSWFVESDLAIT
jgi:hypothetical protein